MENITADGKIKTIRCVKGKKRIGNIGGKMGKYRTYKRNDSKRCLPCDWPKRK